MSSIPCSTCGEPFTPPVKPRGVGGARRTRCDTCRAPSDRVSTAILADAFDKSGLSAAEVGRRMGRMRRKSRQSPHTFADVSAVRRYMGRYPNTDTKKRRLRVNYETAVRFIRACGFDPVDYGL